MARYYGIRLCSANVLLDNQVKDYAISDNDIMWFSTEDAAVRFCDDFFKHQQEMRQVMPELYEQEKTSMPGVAYMWMTDTLTQLNGIPGNPTGYLGSGEAPAQEAAAFAYIPPQGFDASAAQFGHRQYLYSVEMEKYLSNLAKAYTPEGAPQLPEGYQPTVVPPDRVFVHYGSTEFNQEVFTPAYTRFFDVKPEEGFWASPTDSSNNWDNWCKREEFRKNHPNIRCEFTIAPEAKVLQVSTLDDIAYMLANYPTQVTSSILPYDNYMGAGLPYLMIDYEVMAKDWDGISYDHSALGNILGPWDCDSICVFNPECMRFREIELVPVENEAQYDEFSDICTDEDWLDEEEW